MPIWTRFQPGLWLLAYELEEARQAHAAGRRYLRSAACCVALFLLRASNGSAA